MEKDRTILPIEAIEKTLRVKPIGRIRLFKRPEYMPKQTKDNHSQKEKELEEKEKEKVEIKNHASHGSGMIGVSVDYKV